MKGSKSQGKIPSIKDLIYVILSGRNCYFDTHAIARMQRLLP
jgi:hypothetical protein